ncbi:MAG: MFS transporter [Anaerolineaceae bacterium]|nr:MFS transporter [Anaerolineaceae bacterium]
MTTSSENETRKPLLSPTLKVFLLTMILANIAGAMYSSFLPLYLKQLGANVAQIGLFFTISQIIPLVLQILGGWISDSIGRLKSIALGSMAGVVSHIALIIAPTWAWVLVSEGFGAVTRSLVGPSFSAFTAEEANEENRARVFGVVDAFYNIVAIVGPPLGGFMIDHYGFKVMLIASAVLYTIATVIRVIMAKRATKNTNNEGTKGKLDLRELRINLIAIFGLVLAGGVLTWIVVTDGIRDIAFSLSGTLIPVYLEDVGLSAQQIGILGSALGVAMMLTSYPAGHLADKIGERLTIALGFALQAAGLFTFVAAENFFVYAASYALIGIGMSLMSPAYQSLLSKVLPQKLRGTGFGLIQSGLGFFSLPAPAIGAKLYASVGPKSPFWITAIASVFAMFPAIFKFKLSDKDRQQIDAAEAKMIKDEGELKE